MIDRFVTGDYTMPPDHRLAGQRVFAVAYLIRHPDALVLFDTGFPLDSTFTVVEGDAELTTYPRSLEAALASRQTSLREIDVVANCHLHIDHAGGNHRIPAGTPIHVQETEIRRAREIDAAEEELVRDALRLDEKSYRPTDGELELLPGIAIVPTPGHTDGHQSLLVSTDTGTVFLGGQAMPSASDFALAVYARQLEEEGDGPVPPYPAWLPRVLDARPTSAMFAHDLAVWEEHPA